MTRKRKPKFEVGQIVRNGATLFQVTKRFYDAERESWMYTDIWSSYFEAALRPLTKREAGRRD